MRVNLDLPLDVVGVGNAIVDVIAAVSDDFLVDHGLVKGSMRLIDTDQARDLYGAMPASEQISGGSAANTTAGVASFGARSAYIGKVRNDDLGDVFVRDMAADGIVFPVGQASDGDPTARSLILVTPDGERTMNTFLGVSAFLSPSDIDEETVATSAVTYCEGYLWDRPEAKDAIREAMAICSANQRVTSLTLSDSFCVDRHRDEWLDLIDDRVDLVFANEAEVCSLFQTDDFDTAASELASMVQTAALTRSAQGSVVLDGADRISVGATPVDEVVDATGAGDLYAAGFLYGLSIGAPLDRCAELGSIAAAEVIAHVGARPQVALSTLANAS